MTAGRVTVLTVGHVTHDDYQGRVRAGGSAFFGARTARALGARSRLVTSVGVDFERYDELGGLELLMRVQGSTTTFENTYREGQARTQRLFGVAPAVTPASMPFDWRTADVLFLASVIGEIDAEAWLDTVDTPFVGLGLQGFLKRPGAMEDGDTCEVHATDSPPISAGDVRARSVASAPLPFGTDVLERIDVVFASDEDLAQFGALDLLATLRRSVSVVVLTLGASGSRVWYQGRECRVGTFPALARDPTGAGDVFAAAFLISLAEGTRPEEAARLASAAASIVIEAEAGTALARLSDYRARAAHVPILRTDISEPQ